MFDACRSSAKDFRALMKYGGILVLAACKGVIMSPFVDGEIGQDKRYVNVATICNNAAVSNGF